MEKGTGALLYIQLAHLLLFFFTAIVAFLQFRAFHERRKKEATIEFINKVREVYRKVNYELKKEFGEGPLDEEKLSKLYANTDLWNQLKNMLALFEHLAVGVNSGVFDFDILSRMSGQYLINMFDRYSFYIRDRRKKLGNPRLYEEFEALVAKLRQHRNKLTTKGNIKYS